MFVAVVIGWGKTWKEKEHYRCRVFDLTDGKEGSNLVTVVPTTPPPPPPKKPAEVYLCVLRHDDGTFKTIVGCFYDYDRAVRYADGSPRITIHKQSVI